MLKVERERKIAGDAHVDIYSRLVNSSQIELFVCDINSVKQNDLLKAQNDHTDILSCMSAVNQLIN